MTHFTIDVKICESTIKLDNTCAGSRRLRAGASALA